MQSRRIGAYGLLKDAEGRVLLARNSALSEFPDRWGLPGGGVEQGEDPADAVVREFAEETGLSVRVTALHAVLADVAHLPNWGLEEHTDRVVYEVEQVGGELRDEIGGTTDRVEWLVPDDKLLMMPFTSKLLGLPIVEQPGPPRRGQRFSAYAVATDPAGRILLTLISDGFPGAGLWHLPGGGTDHGESPEQGLERELTEETSQQGRITGLLGVSNLHNPAALGPEGVPVDWHVVRVLFSVSIDAPTEPVVTETGGSTAEAAWFTPATASDLALTEVARDAVTKLLAAAVG